MKYSNANFKSTQASAEHLSHFKQLSEAEFEVESKSEADFEAELVAESETSVRHKKSHLPCHPKAEPYES